MEKTAIHKTFEIQRYKNGVLYNCRDELVIERQARLEINGCFYAEFLATPSDLKALAVGFIFYEGLIKNASDIIALELDGLTIKLEINGPQPEMPGRARSSGFGRGAFNLNDPRHDSPLATGLKPLPLKASELSELMAEFNLLSGLYNLTGAAHSAWLRDGQRCFFAEDVGRHNAIDKVIGHYLLSRAPMKQGSAESLLNSPRRTNNNLNHLDLKRPEARPLWIITSGRLTSEMTCKAIRAGAELLISSGAATVSALRLARKFNLSLISFARGAEFNLLNGQPPIG